MKNRENGIYNRIVKRITDLVLSALIMLILSPLLLLLVLAIKLDSKRSCCSVSAEACRCREEYFLYSEVSAL